MLAMIRDASLVATAHVGTVRRLPAIRALPPGERRLEIGSGPYPTPGYVHVDLDPRAAHLELRAPTHRIPLPDDWADEIRAVHVLEHVFPKDVESTLREWKRVLRPYGLLDVHVPDGAALAGSLTDGDPERFWAAQVGIFGYPGVPVPVEGPQAVDRNMPEHRMLFTAGQLEEMLRRAGFSEVRRPEEHICRHNGPWDSQIPDFCLRLSAKA